MSIMYYNVEAKRVVNAGYHTRQLLTQPAATELYWTYITHKAVFSSLSGPTTLWFQMCFYGARCRRKL